MKLRSILVIALLAFAASLASPDVGQAQFVKKLKDTAKKAAEDETNRQVDRLVEEAVACAFDDPACIDEAERDGKQVVYTDSDGNVIRDSDGNPVTDRDQAAGVAGGDPAGERQRPGQGVWSNYDFMRGDEILFADDFMDDRVGNFPRGLEFGQGNMEIVEWQGGRYLRSTADSQFIVELPEALPEKFTIEFEYYEPTGFYNGAIVTDADRIKSADNPQVRAYYEGAVFMMGKDSGVGGTSKAHTRTYRTREAMTAIRIQVDGNYAKVYTDEERVSNIPNAEIHRGNRLSFHLHGGRDQPAYLGNLVIAGGGRDLYDALTSDGRVTTYGILFDTNSAGLRPESTGTLREIGDMLRRHEELRLLIEGHTDSDGSDEHNFTLSGQRAQAVVDHLVVEYGIDRGRLTSAGLGESRPVDENDTPAGRQRNRRVELVVN
jgi:outer membrane protein OmpA-like peptidoglycan-associated protein